MASGASERGFDRGHDLRSLVPAFGGTKAADLATGDAGRFEIDLGYNQRRAVDPSALQRLLQLLRRRPLILFRDLDIEARRDELAAREQHLADPVQCTGLVGRSASENG